MEICPEHPVVVLRRGFKIEEEALAIVGTEIADRAAENGDQAVAIPRKKPEVAVEIANNRRDGNVKHRFADIEQHHLLRRPAACIASRRSFVFVELPAAISTSVSALPSVTASFAWAERISVSLRVG